MDKDEKPAAGTIRVGVVEDDPAFRAAFVDIIRAAPDAVLAGMASSRAGGLALLRERPADVLLVDLGLPDGSGLDVIRAAQDVWPLCNVVVITAFGDEHHVVQAIEAGAAGYLLKDTAPADLMAQIRTVHGGGSPISPIIARRVLQLMRGRDGRAAASGAARPDMLSARETQVLEHVSRGFTYEEIAQRLGVSRHTVLTFVRRIYAKLEVNSKIEAVNEARRKGLLPR